MTSSPHAPYALGDTHATVAGTEGCKPARESESHKTGRGSDRSLQPDCVKPESLVTADQLRRREYVPWPCTHRPSSDGSRRHPKPVYQPRKRGQPSKVNLATGAKS